MAPWQYCVLVLFDGAPNHTPILYTSSKKQAEFEAGKWPPQYLPRVLHKSETYRMAVLLGTSEGCGKRECGARGERI